MGGQEVGEHGATSHCDFSAAAGTQGQKFCAYFSYTTITENISKISFGTAMKSQIKK